MFEQVACQSTQISWSVIPFLQRKDKSGIMLEGVSKKTLGKTVVEAPGNGFIAISSEIEHLSCKNMQFCMIIFLV